MNLLKLIIMKYKSLLIGLISAVGICQASAQGIQDVPEVSYKWSNVPIVGGGFVDGIVLHPSDKDVRFCRTDMGGAYRWDGTMQRWVAMQDDLSLADSNLQGVESIATDPQDPNSVYIACGTYTGNKNSAICYSRDGGRTFTRVDVPFTMGGNENGRGNGERMMVDPVNGNIIYMGTRMHGLWRSTDRGESWHKVDSFPDVTEKITGNDRQSWSNRGSGIITVIYDTLDCEKGRGCRHIYVAVSLMGRENLFASHDFGESWQAVEGQPVSLRPTHMVMGSDRIIYITYADTPGPSQMKDGAVWKYDMAKKKWSDISPVRLKNGEKAGFGYAAVSVDARNPMHLIVSTHYLDGKHGYSSDEMFRSTDGGRNWKPVFKTGYEYDCSKAPYVRIAPLHWMFDIEIDPFDHEHAMFTTGFGGWETFNLSAVERGEKVIWSLLSEGIEETVPLELYAPAEGARLISGIGDYGSFTHRDLTAPAPEGSHANPHFANCNGVTGAWLRQELIVRVGYPFHNPTALGISYSEDGGDSWTQCASVPVDGARNGHIAVSSDGESWIWTPDRSDAFITRDKGMTWTQCHGLPRNMRVIADKVNPKRFYGVDAVNEIVYSSEDGGLTFRADTLALTVKPPVRRRQNDMRESRGDSRGGQDRIYAMPGREKDLWIAAYDGLYHSTTLEGYDFKALDKVRTIYAFGYGKEAPGAGYPSLYIIGVVNGQYGFFRSDDKAASWVRINDDAHQYGLVLHICGDMQEHGRVYVGTHGRGIITGVPE